VSRTKLWPRMNITERDHSLPLQQFKIRLTVLDWWFSLALVC